MSPLDWLFSLGQFGIKLGLENIRYLADELALPQRTFRAIHIAGTNGKGSVAAMVDTSLRAAGHSVARFTSPHLVHLSERFSINGAPVDCETLADSAERLQHVVTRLRSTGRLEAPPTFFEVTTAMAFELFAREGVTVGIFEVGMGGRLDATNILCPVVSAITTIGRDHHQYLGHSLAEIAREKAGIVKSKVPLVTGRLPDEALAVVRAAARKQGAPHTEAWVNVHVEGVEAQLDATRIRCIRTPIRRYDRIVLSLPGIHQVDNAIVAIRMLEILDGMGTGAPIQAITDGLRGVVWPGRLERRVLQDGREALLDAAHNPDGAAALASFLASRGGDQSPLVFATARDKDARDMLSLLAPQAAAIVITRTSSPRSATLEDLAESVRSVAPHLPLCIEPDVPSALAAAWRLSHRIVVAGSIFLLGDVIRELDRS